MFSARIDGAALKGIKEAAKKWLDFGAQKHRLAVGIFPESTTESGRFVAEYATYNEYGTKHIPARPFMRNTIDAHLDEWKSVIKKYSSANPDDLIGAFELAGEVAAKDVMATIEAGEFAPNSPKTIARKAARGKQNPNTPLIDTGVMEEAVKYKIERGAE